MQNQFAQSVGMAQSVDSPRISYVPIIQQPLPQENPQVEPVEQTKESKMTDIVSSPSSPQTIIHDKDRGDCHRRDEGLSGKDAAFLTSQRLQSDTYLQNIHGLEQSAVAQRLVLEHVKDQEIRTADRFRVIDERIKSDGEATRNMLQGLHKENLERMLNDAKQENLVLSLKKAV